MTDQRRHSEFAIPAKPALAGFCYALFYRVVALQRCTYPATHSVNGGARQITAGYEVFLNKFFTKIQPLLVGAALLAACQLVARIIIQLADLPISEPVMGMFLLFLLLAYLGETPAGLREIAAFLLRWLTLLFVPAGVGVMLYFEPLRGQWAALLLTMLISTAIAMAFTGWLLQRLLSKQHD